MKNNMFEIACGIFVILMIITFIYYVQVEQPRKCIEKGGIVVRDNIGMYEKCIYGGK